MAKKYNALTERTLIALSRALAARSELDSEIEVLLGGLLKERGLPPVGPTPR